MLRAAFMLAALGASAAQHDEAGRVHEHDKGRHDDQILQDTRDLIALPHMWRIGTHLISCQQMQAMAHDPHEDEEHAENARERHDGTRFGRRATDRPASIAANSFFKTKSTPMQTAGGWGTAGTTTFWEEPRRADRHTTSSRQHNARGMSRQQATAMRQQSSNTTKQTKWQHAGATHAASSTASLSKQRRIAEETAPLRRHNARVQRRRRAQTRQHHKNGQKGSKMDQ